MSSIVQIAIELSFWSPVVLFSIGIPSAFFNTIIFVGIKTFRQSPSVYYVIGQSLSDLIVLLILLIENISSISVSTSSMTCKLMLFFSQLTVPCAMSFLCLSAFDRWACTSRSARIRQLSSNNVARRLFPIPFLFWSLIDIPYLIFCDLIPPTFDCYFTNDVFGEIAIYFLAPIFSVLLPLFVLITFSILTYRNIHHHLIRNHLSMWEQQMTRMIIIQTLLSIFCTLPQFIFVIYSIVTLNKRAMRSFYQISIELLINQCTIFIMGIHFISSFYIFFLFSSRLRLTIKKYMKNLWNLKNNQIIPVNITQIVRRKTAIQTHQR
ncbi:unnamed protein product [Adineta steineri]|uniref:G-protein coupled receptors family 1 profile domain-containing protein n=2 Tax=Adineta steineri TaxID=433720 RepID=A0A814KC80_9BILA|nr:unnamed protein product [Adineta steineri]CAF3879881.1 unnamed protein product [Adineta steineri]